MNIQIHTVTSSQFIRLLILEARRLRKVTVPVMRCCITQDDAAEVSGYPRYLIGSWESGRTDPTLFEALTYLQAVGEAA